MTGERNAKQHSGLMIPDYHAPNNHMIVHFNNLSPAEDERLACLMEEAGEIIQAVCKIQRHGYNSRDNRTHLALEIGNLYYMVEMMLTSCDFDVNDVISGIKEKSDKLPGYSHHQINEVFTATNERLKIK